MRIASTLGRCTAVWCCLLSWGMAEKVGFRQLTSVFPVAVQRGTTATVQVRSNFTLDGAYQVFCDRPGIAMSLIETQSIEAPLTARGTPGTPFRFRVEVPQHQEPRIYEVRIATPQAVSSVSHFLVTDFPVVEEQTGDNGRPSDAQKVTLPVAACGVIEEPEDVDCYRFAGKQGERLTFQVYGQRVTAAIHDMVGRGGKYHLDPILTLYSPTGQVIGQNDNDRGGDSLLVATLPQDGEYVLEIRDTRYNGDPRYTYCIEMSARPHVRGTFPLVVNRGSETPVELLSAGGGAALSVPLKTADDAPLGWTTRRFTTPEGETCPVPLGISDVPQLLVIPQIAADPLGVELPVGINGRLASPGDSHRFTFEARKDASYRMLVTSSRWGFPLDSVLELYDASGKKLAEADDQPLSPDSQLVFRAPADGPLTLLLKDLHDRGGTEFVYHLSIERAEPDFQLQGRFYYAMLAPGSNVVWFAKVERQNGFTGPIEVLVDDLPAGVSYTPLTIPASMNHGVMVLSAAADAPINAGLARVSGRATYTGDDGQPRVISRSANVTCELQNGGGGQGFWPIATTLVGVVEPMDLLKVVAEPKELTLSRGGRVEITVEIERRPDYTDPVTIEMTHQYFSSRLGEQLPTGVTVASASTARLSGNTLSGKVILEAAKDAPPVERLPLSVVAGVSISFSISTLYGSNPVYLTIPDEASPPAADAKPARSK